MWHSTLSCSLIDQTKLIQLVSRCVGDRSPSLLALDQLDPLQNQVFKRFEESGIFILI